jgi:hypothetical protein
MQGAGPKCQIVSGSESASKGGPNGDMAQFAEVAT